VPAAKLVVGVPFYGRGWDGVSPGPNGDGLGQAGYEASAPVIGGSEFPYSSIIGNGYLALSNGALVGSGGYTRYWNDVAQVPYLYSPTARRFISYDDPQSMRVKMDFANQRGLGGAMFWELSEDTVVPATSLMDVIYQSLKLP
jgi:chitinase